MNDISLLKQALPYLRHHKKSTVVVKLGGEIAANREALTSLAGDVSLLVHVGIRIVMVHGGGPQATEMQKRLGLEPVMVGGRRVTDEATLDVAKMIFGGKINTDILSALRGQGVSAVGLSGVDGDILHARKRPPTEVVDPATGERKVVDYGLVGDITAVEGGVGRGHIVSGTQPGALLLELFTSAGCGTLIAEPHDQVEIVDGKPRG